MALQVWARNPARQRRGELLIIEGAAVLRDTDVGTWTLTVPGDHKTSKLLAPGWGVIVYEDGALLFSGPIEELRTVRSGTLTSRVVSGVTDTVHLADRLVYPDPAQTAETQTSAYWARLGVGAFIGDLLAALINRNAGPEALAPRQVSGLAAVAYGSRNGTRSYVNARFTNLLGEVRALARAGGYVIDVAQTTGTTLECRIRTAADLSLRVRFAPDNGGLQGYDVAETAPELTTVFVAGQGEGAARVIRERSGNTGWGRRVESFVDRRDTSDVNALIKEGDVTLAESAASASATFDVGEDDRHRFGVHYQLGDRVALDLDNGVTIAEPVRVAELRWGPHSRSVRLTVGDPLVEDKVDESAARVGELRELSRKLNKLEVRR